MQCRVHLTPFMEGGSYIGGDHLMISDISSYGGEVSSRVGRYNIMEVEGRIVLG